VTLGDSIDANEPPRITVFLADDSLLVREGVRALLAAQADLDVVGVAEDFDTLVAGAADLNDPRQAVWRPLSDVPVEAVVSSWPTSGCLPRARSVQRGAWLPAPESRPSWSNA
jgi:hypothetical protein